jgi:tRNA-specific 2-thiouridylase
MTPAKSRHSHLKTPKKKKAWKSVSSRTRIGQVSAYCRAGQKAQGEIVNLHGQVLATTTASILYDRPAQGPAAFFPQPLYVIELDAANNRVVVGDESALDRAEFNVERCNWISSRTRPSLEVTAKIRYNHPALRQRSLLPWPGKATCLNARCAPASLRPGRLVVVAAGLSWSGAQAKPAVTWPVQLDVFYSRRSGAYDGGRISR